MLQTMMECAEEEGTADQTAPIEHARVEERRGLGQEGAVDVDKSNGGRILESRPRGRAHEAPSGVELNQRPIRSVRSRASAGSTASAITRTIGSVLLARM